ncbi:Cerato-platanin [Gymnopilus junonius]|uniref:Cerato-platanin n=1 Tax=Gymnopilus junonius TaxID=109634 RepID=A0A9P5NXB5_GYMJU|nr:Cerato-platanin [Gymnopilus junonius]
MKFATLFSSFTLSVLSVYGLTVSYDTAYDNAGQSLNTVACSDGANGLESLGFTTFGSLPSFPTSAVHPPLTYINTKGVSKSINILAIDVATPNFNIAEEAMNTLTGGQAVQLGRVTITAKQVSQSACGL